MLQKINSESKKTDKKIQEKQYLDMSSAQFREWRRSLGLKQKDAAELLGLKKRMIQYYEKGMREDKAVEIPKSVRLACYAIQVGIGDFDGKEHLLANLDAYGKDSR